MLAISSFRFFTVCLFLFFDAASARSVRHTAVPEGSTIALPCGWMKNGAGDAAANAATLEEADRAASELSWRFGRHGSKEIFVGFSAVVGGKWDSAKFDLLAKVKSFRRWDKQLSADRSVGASVTFCFLDVFSHLYTRVCRCVRQSVGQSVHHTRVEFLKNGLNLNKIASGT